MMWCTGNVFAFECPGGCDEDGSDGVCNSVECCCLVVCVFALWSSSSMSKECSLSYRRHLRLKSDRSLRATDSTSHRHSVASSLLHFIIAIWCYFVLISTSPPSNLPYSIATVLRLPSHHQSAITSIYRTFSGYVLKIVRCLMSRKKSFPYDAAFQPRVFKKSSKVLYLRPSKSTVAHSFQTSLCLGHERSSSCSLSWLPEEENGTCWPSIRCTISMSQQRRYSHHDHIKRSGL